jgi:hypothetical protein
MPNSSVHVFFRVIRSVKKYKNLLSQCIFTEEMNNLGKLEIVIGPQRSGTQLVKAAVQQTSTGLVEMHITTFDP